MSFESNPLKPVNLANMQSGYVEFKMAMYGCETVKFEFSLKSYFLEALEVSFLDSPRKVDKENLSQN